MQRILVRSPLARYRQSRAEAWLAGLARGQEALIVGASAESARDLSRRVAQKRGACFGWQRTTLGRLAATLAGPALGARGLAPVGALPLEALSARVVDGLHRRNALGRFAPVAQFPGFPRALARTLTELRGEGVTPERLLAEGNAELAELLEIYEAELAGARLADRALVMRIAAKLVSSRSKSAILRSPLLGKPLALFDLSIAGAVERDLIAALVSRAPCVFATVPTGDDRSLEHLTAALETKPEAEDGFDGDPAAMSSLRRLQAFLFSDAPAPSGALGGDVVILSAPGESRECVEIARAVQTEAARGVPFDRMAILLRAPSSYRAHLEEALRRAGIPAFFAKGTVEPDPAGRAFVALLACASEKLSARRFAEYLSLAQVPDPSELGAPPPALGQEDRWVPPDEEMLSDRVAMSARSFTSSKTSKALEAELELSPDSESSPAAGGTLRAPHRWERLLVEAAVIGGLDRWERRLEALEKRLELELEASGREGDAGSVRALRSLSDLGALRRFAIPLLRELDALPAHARWGEWIDKLGALSTRALRSPERVLAVLAELAPMSEVGPVDLDEVRLVLHRRLTDLVILPVERSAGRIFVAPIEAARGLSFSVVFVPGLAEKIFPQKVSEDPILLDRARELLSLDTNHERIESERLALRLAAGAAEDRLLLSYPRIDMDQSRPRVPSFYGLEVLRAAEGTLPGFDELAQRAEQTGAARIGWPAPARLELAIDEAEYDLGVLETLFERPEEETVGTAHYLLGANDHLARALRFRARRWMLKKWVPADGLVEPMRAKLDRHAPTRHAYSATALSAYASCPYRFLLYAVHRLSPRREPEAIEEMGAAQKSALIREALFELWTSMQAEGALPLLPESLDEARARLDAIVSRLASRYKDELAPAIERVWEEGIATVRADLRELLRRASLDGSFSPLRFELAFGLEDLRGRDPESLETPIELDSGLKLRGSIDLVEESEGGTLRATDYRTGHGRARSQRTVIGGGQLLKPLLHALALEKLFPGRNIESGRLYYCTSAGGFSEVSVVLDEEARRAIDELTQVICESFEKKFLPAAPAPGACDRCEYRVVCGPYEEMRTAKKSVEPLKSLSMLRELP